MRIKASYFFFAFFLVLFFFLLLVFLDAFFFTVFFSAFGLEAFFLVADFFFVVVFFFVAVFFFLAALSLVAVFFFVVVFLAAFFLVPDDLPGLARQKEDTLAPSDRLYPFTHEHALLALHALLDFPLHSTASAVPANIKLKVATTAIAAERIVLIEITRFS